MQPGLVKVNLRPAQVADFGRPQAMAIAHEDHGRVAMPAPVVLGLSEELINLSGGEVLALAQFRIRRAPRCARANCTIFDDWGNQPESRFHWGFPSELETTARKLAAFDAVEGRKRPAQMNWPTQDSSTRRTFGFAVGSADR